MEEYQDPPGEGSFADLRDKHMTILTNVSTAGSSTGKFTNQTAATAQTVATAEGPPEKKRRS